MDVGSSGQVSSILYHLQPVWFLACLMGIESRWLGHIYPVALIMRQMHQQELVHGFSKAKCLVRPIWTMVGPKILGPLHVWVVMFLWVALKNNPRLVTHIYWLRFLVSRLNCIKWLSQLLQSALLVLDQTWSLTLPRLTEIRVSALSSPNYHKAFLNWFWLLVSSAIKLIGELVMVVWVNLCSPGLW